MVAQQLTAGIKNLHGFESVKRTTDILKLKKNASGNISREGKGEAVATPSPLSQWGQFPIFTGVTVSVTGRPLYDCPKRGVFFHALAAWENRAVP
jgi:hypothetical protein